MNEAYSCVRVAQAQSRLEAGGGSLDKSQGNLLYHLATRFKGTQPRLEMVLEYICDRRIASEPQLTGLAGLFH